MPAFKHLNNYKKLFVINLINLFCQYKLAQQISNEMSLAFSLLINDRLEHNSAYCKLRHIYLHPHGFLKVIMTKH